MKYADILFTRKLFNDSETLTYEIPEEMILIPGDAVKVPLKRQTISGIILNLHDNKPEFRTQKIKEKSYESPLLNSERLNLLEWLADYYFCEKYKVLKLFLPERILNAKPVRKSKKTEEQISRSEDRALTAEQGKILDKVTESKKNKFLIQGVTGSGKTEVYTRIAQHFIEKKQQVLILVPEISLTPQTIDYFEKSLGIKSAVINSKLSEGQRYHAWMDIWTGQTKLVIGSRSAIFAPFQDLGCIIIDEEHENSYKQDNAPRYHTHQVAEKIIELLPGAKLIYGSATPSIETKERLKDTTLHLKERFGESVLPKVEIVDLRDEFKKKNFSIFSEALHEAITQTLKSKKQAILFLNRRGSASSVVCRDCGYTAECNQCEMPLTYHTKTLTTPTLICHHCGIITPPPGECPKCQGPNIRFLGIGTQKIEEEVKKAFPKARVLRADRDTTSTKEGFKDIYTAFKKHDADILIGTQMIAKGLHLPKVHLVGVVLADIGLNIPDFRTSERTFQLVTQVAGRAGRSKDRGQVIIQTYSPDNFSLQKSLEHDYEGFFEYERNQRALLKNPPFSQLAKILIEDTSQKNTTKTAEEIVDTLWHIARTNNFTDQLEIHSYPAYITKLKGKHRHIILIKSSDISDNLHILLKELTKSYEITPSIKIDIDPLQIT